MNNIRWMSLFGRFDLGGESIRFVPTIEQSEDGSVAPSAGQVASNLDFVQGDISFDVLFEDPLSVCTVVFNTNEGLEPLHVGLNLGGAYGMAKYTDTWDIIKSVGTAEQLQAHQTYHVRVSVVRSQIQLFVNDVLVLEGQADIRRSPIHLYTYGQKPVIVPRFQCERPTVYVALSEPMNELCGDVVHDAIQAVLLEPLTVNLEYSSTDDVVDSVKSAVCVITNVADVHTHGFYTVGLAQGFDKPNAVLCHKQDRPMHTFYSNLTQMVYYDESTAGLDHLQASVKRFLDTVI